MILYGAGGHGKVVSTILDKKISFFFDKEDRNELLNDLRVVKYSEHISPYETVIVTIGDNRIRNLVSKSCKHDFSKIIHETALVDYSTTVGVGSQLLHRCVIQAGTIIGKHTIINTSASIDHDCQIGDYAHIAPNSTLCGNVEIGEGTLIGAGTTIIPGVRIGKWCVIGAGSVVVNDMPDNVLAFGNPAKIIRKNE